MTAQTPIPQEVFDANGELFAGVKETIKEVIANAGSAVIQASILATNSIRIANNLVLEEVWGSQEELISKMSNRINREKA